MSSKNVRSALTNFLKTNISDVKVIDITTNFEEIDEFLTANNINELTDTWIGIQYLSATETPIDIVADNTQGKYREEGDVFIHVVGPTVGGYESVLILSERVRNLLRGRRINQLVIDSVDPAQFGRGISLSFEFGMTSGLITVGYHYDLILS